MSKSEAIQAECLQLYLSHFPLGLSVPSGGETSTHTLGLVQEAKLCQHRPQTVQEHLAVYIPKPPKPIT